ncbi:MAG: YceI family protein, partial [Caldilineaceae bacterium]
KRTEEGSEFISGQFTVDISTLTTTRNQRDEWIRDNALESNKFPIAAFTATAVEGAPALYTEGEEVSFKLLGDLLVRDITQPVTFDVTAKLEGDTLTAIATTKMKITDFGFDPPSFANTLTVADGIEIRVDIVAHAQEVECGCDPAAVIPRYTDF